MTMNDKPKRFFVISPDGGRIDGFEAPVSAEAAALAHGDGAHIVDTVAQVYHPIAQFVENGEVKYLEYGAWDTSVSPDDNVIEAVKKGYAPIVQAFLAKGGSASAVDAKGGTALHWAAARGIKDVVLMLLEAGADPAAGDSKGRTPAEIAMSKHPEIAAAILERCPK